MPRFISITDATAHADAAVVSVGTREAGTWLLSDDMAAGRRPGGPAVAAAATTTAATAVARRGRARGRGAARAAPRAHGMR